MLLAAALALTPQEERGAQERPQLSALRDNTALRSKLAPAAAGVAPGAGALVDGPTAVLKLCWGILGGLLQQGQAPAAAAAEEARRSLLEATASGALRYLRHLFSAPYFKLDDAVHQQVVSCVVYRLVGQALQADTATGGAMVKAAAERCMAPFRRSGATAGIPSGPPGTPGGMPGTPGGAFGFGASAFSPAPLPSQQQQQLVDGVGAAQRGDHLGHALALLAAAFGVHPQLWLNPDQPSAMVSCIISCLIQCLCECKSV